MFVLRGIKVSYYDNNEDIFNEGVDLQVEVDGDSVTISFLSIDENVKSNKWVNSIFDTKELKRVLSALLFYRDHGMYDKWIGVDNEHGIGIDCSVEEDGSLDITLFIFHIDYRLYVDILDARAILLAL